MITNPYKILGVQEGASVEECTKAYKVLAKKYHPDLNPNDPSAAEKMAEINAAYDQIKNGKVNNQNNGYNYQNSNANRSSSSNNSSYINSALQFIKNHQYMQAKNLLSQIEDRNAQWYYASALANVGLGNNKTALNHIQQACAMEPNNYIYNIAYSQIRNSIHSQNNNYTRTYTYTYDTQNGYGNFNENSRGNYYNRNNNQGTNYNQSQSKMNAKGCLWTIVKVFLIILALRLAFSFIGSVALHNRIKRYYNQPQSSYSQQYDEHDRGSNNNHDNDEHYSGSNNNHSNNEHYSGSNNSHSNNENNNAYEYFGEENNEKAESN